MWLTLHLESKGSKESIRLRNARTVYLDLCQLQEEEAQPVHTILILLCPILKGILRPCLILITADKFKMNCGFTQISEVWTNFCQNLPTQSQAESSTSMLLNHTKFLVLQIKKQFYAELLNQLKKGLGMELQGFLLLSQQTVSPAVKATQKVCFPDTQNKFSSVLHLFKE